MSARGGRTTTDSGGVGNALRRYQERFEPVAIRVLLLGIFVTGLTAQFVKPVGDALQGKAYLGGALLSLVGYVLYDAVKELSTSLRLPARRQVKSRELGSFVSEAFRERTVDIRFLGYTGETLYNELYHRLEGLEEDPGPTRRVTIRVLIPDFGQPMTVPSRVGDEGAPQDDPDFRKRLERKCQEYDETLSVLAERLTAHGRIVAHCEYRVYPGIPMDKICIFNRELVLHGLYDVMARTVPRGAAPEYYDPKGYGTDLNVWSLEAAEDSKALIATWNRHLDNLWRLAAPPPWRGPTTAPTP
ncbi:hypothetical protein [Streptomyces sp. T028]|uniref:hypothetical protein n=1 Tax=Streptomyces sp. T028 TaxID=3394379 RepID=UPI003A84493A